MDHEKIVTAVRMILEAVGEDPGREGLRDTPERVARMYEEVFSGLHQDPREAVSKIFREENYDEIVLLKDVPFHSMCEHHLLPFTGRAHIGYIPGKGPESGIVGLSKLARAVDVFSRRPQVQERLTNQIADLIEDAVVPRGVVVVLEAEHTCMTIRGVRKPGSLMITSAMRGVFRDNLASRNEVLGLIRNGSR